MDTYLWHTYYHYNIQNNFNILYQTYIIIHNCYVYPGCRTQDFRITCIYVRVSEINEQLDVIINIVLFYDNKNILVTEVSVIKML